MLLMVHKFLLYRQKFNHSLRIFYYLIMLLSLISRLVHRGKKILLMFLQGLFGTTGMLVKPETEIKTLKAFAISTGSDRIII